MKEVRCEKCKRMLCKVSVTKGTIEAKCSKCKHINQVNVENLK